MGRTLHLVDADNLLRDPFTTDRQRIASVFAAYRRAAGYQGGDLVVVAMGCNARHVLEVELAWPRCLHRRRSGRNGADIALIEEATNALDRGTIDRVVIGSGDGIFAPTIHKLQTAGLDVRVVACRASVSQRLRSTGVRVIDLNRSLLALAA